jgi:hypothetical protein
MIVKIVVHQRKGKRAMPKRTEKLGRNQVRGGLQVTLAPSSTRGRESHLHSSSASGDLRLIVEEARNTEDGDNERRNDLGRAPASSRAGRDRKDEQDEGGSQDGHANQIELLPAL